MIKSKSLINGIGNIAKTRKYYDDWAPNYDLTLKNWNYQAPKKSINLLKKKITKKPKYILDLACGTGLFGKELRKIYKKSHIYGSDISMKSIRIALKRNIYENVVKNNFEIKYDYKIKFNLVSMIGAMTYCKNFNNLFSNINYYLHKNGYFIFSHRIDLWEKQDFDYILKHINKNLKVLYVSKPYKYLPLNKDFKNIIKIRLVLLKKA